MRKPVKVLLLIVAALVILVGIAAAFVAIRGIPKYAVQKINVKIEYTPERVANGEKLASMLCTTCHYNDDTHKFSGRELTEVKEFGKIYSKNVTRDSAPTEPPESQPSFLTKFLCTVAFKPFPYPKETIAAPDTTDPVKHGRYIALSQLECFSCHSKDFAKTTISLPKNPWAFSQAEIKCMTGKVMKYLL